jgi:uncharacterized protein (DUF58 family)
VTASARTPGEEERELPVDERFVRAAKHAARRAFSWTVAFLSTRRLVIALAVLSPIWLLSDTPTGAAVALIITLLFAGAVLYDALSNPAQWQLSVERRVPESVGIGDSVTGEYVVRSRAGRRLHFEFFDALPRGVASDDARRGTHTVARGAELSLPLTLTGRERGSFALGPVVLRTFGRLRLMQRTHRYPLADRIIVTPSLAGVRHYRLLTLQHRLRDIGVRTIRRRGEGTSFANLREYALGDDPRRIDWKASARRQKLITREYTVEQGQTVMIAVDAGRMMTQLSGEVPRFEHALSAATLLADVAAQSSDYVGAIVFDDEVRAFVPPARGHSALVRIRAALTPVTASMAEPDYAAAFRLLAARQRKRSLIVLFTDVIDARASRSLVALLARSASRHLSVVVAMRNDRLMQAAVPARESSSTELFESAAAEELVLAREEALARMRGVGVSVLDVSPQAMSAVVINRYLEIKARASL